MLWFVFSSIHIQYNTVYILDGANNSRNANNRSLITSGTPATPGKQGNVQHQGQKECQQQKGRQNSIDAMHKQHELGGRQYQQEYRQQQG
jgi:hypothetical protein